VWIELKPEQLNTPFYLSINRTRGLGEKFVYPFMMRGYVVEFRKVGGLVQMIAKNPRYKAKEGTPLALAAEQSFTDSLLGSTTVASQAHPEKKSILIEANALFIADIAGPRPSSKPSTARRTRSTSATPTSPRSAPPTTWRPSAWPRTSRCPRCRRRR
jgi:hypothetical protein